MNDTITLPVVPLRNAVLFPGVSFPISAGRAGTLRAIETAMKTPDRRVFAVMQREDVEGVTAEGLHSIGAIATIGSLQRGLGAARLVLEGRQRAMSIRVTQKDGMMEAAVRPTDEMPPLDAKDP